MPNERVEAIAKAPPDIVRDQTERLREVAVVCTFSHQERSNE